MMNCRIERLISGHEGAVIIRIPETLVSELVVQFAGLYLGKIQNIHMADKASDNSVDITRKAAKTVEYAVKVNGQEFPVSKTLLEAVASLMTDVAINGWSETAHMDVEMNARTSLCFIVEPPIQ